MINACRYCNICAGRARRGDSIFLDGATVQTMATRRTLLALLLGIGLAVMAGCGSKGPLELPEDRPSQPERQG